MYDFVISIHIDKINPVFTAQNIRLLAPVLFPDEVCILSGIDIMPLSKNYFFEAIKNIDESNFIIYRPEACPPEMLALWLALVLYTASFIAEIVRAGILAIHKGQTEASYAVGLGRGETLRLIVIPQALRVIVPPLTSQYLNLTKNYSLAVAIANTELV